MRVKLPSGVTCDQLAKLSPDQVKARDIFPAGFLPLPHPNHPEGGMLFPKFEIDEMNKQENRYTKMVRSRGKRELIMICRILMS